MGERKVKSIPSWQRADAPAVPTSRDESFQHGNESSLPVDSSRPSAIDQASRSLQDDGIRDAPLERKRSYLKSKGLSNDEVDNLLSVSQTNNESSDGGDETQVNDSPPNLEERSSAKGEAKAVDERSSGPTPSSSHDIPPIITYPEFLLHAPKPPPLITVNRLLTSIYVISGAAATAYGLSNYIGNPMFESLNAARHSFFETASSNLQILVEKLEQVVSSIPDATSSPKNLLLEDDDSSTNSDAAEFFRRSTGTQTTPGLPRSPPSTTSQTPGSISPLVEQHIRLQWLHVKLSDMMISTENRPRENDVKFHVDNLQNYLNSMAYDNSIRNADLAVEKDQIAKVKAEIRSVKGVLLSARNFP